MLTILLPYPPLTLQEVSGFRGMEESDIHILLEQDHYKQAAITERHI